MSASLEDQTPSEELKAKEKTMGLSIKEGSFAGISLTFGDNFIIPYALSLQATSIQVGVLSSLVGIISPTAQIYGSHLMERHSRKRILVMGVLFQALMWISFISLALLFINNISIAALPILLIVFYMIYLIFGNIAGPAWFSLIGDIVPEDHRGRYFAKRSLITTAIALFGTIIVSLVLDNFKALGMVLNGFIIIFIVALFCRSTSSVLLSKHYDPPLELEKKIHISLWQFIKDIPKENFGRFTLYVALINFGQMIAGPFFSVYMLKELDFDYTIFIIINLSASFVGLLIFPLLGRFSDKFGNILMLRLSSIALPIIPIIWMFFNTPITIIFGPQLLSGLGWTAFNLAASNFIYDSIPSQRRGFYVAYYNFILGIGIFCGGLVGSYIISFSITFMNQFHFVFLISGVVRAVAIVIFLFRIKEVRQVYGINWHFYFWRFNVHRFLYWNFGRKPTKRRTKNDDLMESKE